MRRSVVDVAVVGAGPVGATLVALLANRLVQNHSRKLKVALLDANPKALHKMQSLDRSVPPDPRVLAVSANTKKLWQEIGAWDLLDHGRVKPFDQMYVWDAFTNSRLHLDNKSLGLDEPLGHLIESKNIISSLSACLENQVNIDLQHFIPSKITNIDNIKVPESSSNVSLSNDCDVGADATAHEDAWVSIGLEDDLEIQASLVVGSDGSRSIVKNFAGIGSRGHSYNQRAVIASVELRSPSSTAWQRFLPTGTLAVLPAHENFATIVWSTTDFHANKLTEYSPDQFTDALNEALTAHLDPSLRTCVPKVVSSVMTPLQSDPPRISATVSHVVSFPLQLVVAEAFASKRVTLIGDSAHAIHPLAGQGMNLGMKDADFLSKHLANGFRVGQDLGDADFLTPFNGIHRIEMCASILGIDMIQKMFMSKDLVVSSLRSLGMHVINASPELKKVVSALASS